MGEGNIYMIGDLEFDVLKCYIKHGYGDMKIYHSDFFMIRDDEQAVLTLQEFYERAVQARKEEGITDEEV